MLLANFSKLSKKLNLNPEVSLTAATQLCEAVEKACTEYCLSIKYLNVDALGIDTLPSEIDLALTWKYLPPYSLGATLIGANFFH